MSPIETKQNNNGTKSSSNRVKFRQILQHSLEEDNIDHDNINHNYNSYSSSSTSSPRLSNSTTTTTSPRFSNFDEIYSSPLPNTTSPYLKSPWIKLSPLPNTTPLNNTNQNLQFIRGRKCLIGSLFREEGHIYSLAVRNGVLYTGSESQNIRVWRDFHDSGGFKSGSGLVKAIVTSLDDKVFTGHQDGKIRIWNPNGKRVGTLPKFKDYVKSSINPKSYVEVRRHYKVPKIKHFDAVSCLSLNEEFGLLYSGSWDKTIKVWRIYDGRCLESIEAHNDAINSIVVGFDGLVFSGSADGSVKVWRRELDGENVRHFLVKTLLKQENAVTALAVTTNESEGENGWVVYGGSSNGLVNFWEKNEEEMVVYGGVLRGHKLAVLCLVSVGSLVFSGSADKMICVWRREGDGIHSCLAVLSGHLGPVKCLAVELDDNINHSHDDDDDDEDNQRRDWIVYSGSLDKSVKIWRVSEHMLEDESSYDIY